MTKENFKNLHLDLKRLKIHQLVAMAFLYHKPNGYKLVINHINLNHLDNKLSNLEIYSDFKQNFKSIS